MALNRTVLPNGIVQPQHGQPYETDEDANWALIDQSLGGLMMADLGMNGVASGLQISTSATLVPGITAGVLYAQGQRVPFNLPPTLPAAPANSTNYLFYNSATGFYYQTSAVGATAGDALIGQVSTSGSVVFNVVQATPIMGTVSVPALTDLSPSFSFSLPHYLGRAPLGASIRMTSPGAIWFQSAPGWDGTYLYLVASDYGVTAVVQLW